MQHSMAYLLEESRRKEQATRMAAQRAAREAALATGTLPKEQPTRKRRMAARGGESGGLPASMQAVLDFLSDGLEHTNAEGARTLSMKETSFASRLRHLRLEKNGAHNIQCRVGDVITEHGRVRCYRLVS